MNRDMFTLHGAYADRVSVFVGSTAKKKEPVVFFLNFTHNKRRGLISPLTNFEIERRFMPMNRVAVLIVISVILLAGCGGDGGGDTPTGPDPEPEPDPPEITSVEPDSGSAGTEVTILGENFSPTASENTITFNGTDAPVNEAEDTLLVTEVPEGASTGPVEVTVEGQTATGPEFNVLTEGALEVMVATSGPDQDIDDYKLRLDADTANSRLARLNDTLSFDPLEQGMHEVHLVIARFRATIPEPWRLLQQIRPPQHSR
jgi:hypothetical protein